MADTSLFDDILQMAVIIHGLIKNNSEMAVIQYNTINNLYCAKYLTKLSLRGTLQV